MSAPQPMEMRSGSPCKSEDRRGCQRLKKEGGKEGEEEEEEERGLLLLFSHTSAT